MFFGSGKFIRQFADFFIRPLIALSLILKLLAQIVRSEVKPDWLEGGIALACCPGEIYETPVHDKEIKARGYTFPYLLDETQDVATRYTAACTPDFFLYDADGKLVYRGQFDDSRPNNEAPVDGADLRAALDTVLAGKPPLEDQKASIGCNIKWKPGNQPGYA